MICSGIHNSFLLTPKSHSSDVYPSVPSLHYGRSGQYKRIHVGMKGCRWSAMDAVVDYVSWCGIESSSIFSLPFPRPQTTIANQSRSAIRYLVAPWKIPTLVLLYLLGNCGTARPTGVMNISTVHVLLLLHNRDTDTSISTIHHNQSSSLNKQNHKKSPNESAVPTFMHLSKLRRSRSVKRTDSHYSLPPIPSLPPPWRCTFWHSP